MSVVVCGVAFSESHVPVDGLIYSRLVGWDGRPAARGGGDAVSGGQGEFPRSVELRESRVITVEAAIISDSASEYMAAKRRVENIPMFGEMRVDQGDGVWTRAIEIASIDIPDARGATETEFTIDMVAPDPVRYSDVLTAGPALLPVQVGGLTFPAAFPWDFGTFDHAKAVVTNTGALPILPRIIIESLVPDGPVFADSVTVFAGPHRLEFGPFSGRLVFDALERRAWLNGVDVTRQIVRREWPVVGPGETQEFYFEAVNPSPNISLLGEYKIGVW